MTRSVIFAKNSLAFDFDIDRFVPLWGASPFPVDQNEDCPRGAPSLAVLVRLICLPLARMGLDARLAACGVAALCAALSRCDRLPHRAGPGAGAAAGLYVMTMLWTVSTASLLLGVLPETYCLAFVALGYQALLAVRWAQGDEPKLAARFSVALANFGITITNAVFSGLVELVNRLMRQPWRKALLATAAFSAAVGVIGLVLSIVSFLIWPVQNVDSSARAFKQLYWSTSSAESDKERQSPRAVAWTFGAISFVAPPAARYPFRRRYQSYLWDVRGTRYSAEGWIAVLGWLGLLGFGAVAAARDRMLRPLWIVAAGWIAANLALHSYWQFRDTLFLYSPHSHIAFFLLVLAGAGQAQDQGKIFAYAIAAGLVTLLMIAVNLPLYNALPFLN